MINLLAVEETSSLLKTETAAVILLVIAAGVAILVRRVNFPFTVALVVAGFFATALGEVVEVDVSPDLIIALLVPPLLFEATLHLAWRKLKIDLLPVLFNALLGTLLGIGVIGALVHIGLDIPWEAAFAFGALISATDPVAVVAFFKSLGTPKRLSVLVEGESLFNDGVAVVAFTLAVDAARGEAFTIGGALSDFLIVSAGGLAVGLVLGYIVSEIILARVDDALIETSTTLALAFGSFLLAEEFGLLIGQDDLHFSGILAVVAAGLMVGNLGTKNTSPTTRITLEHFWELLTFLVNSMVFLFIGLSVSLSALFRELPAVGLAIVGVLAVRLVVVYGFSQITGRMQPTRRVPIRYQHVMFWGGLRGAISLALALTLSVEVFDNDTVETLRVMTFGVVLFTLLVQGTTISALIARLGLSGKDENELAQQRHQAIIHMRRAGQNEMARMGGEGVLFDDLADAIGRSYQRDLQTETVGFAEHFRTHPELEAAMLIQARRDALHAEQSALTEVVRTGLIESQVADELTIDLNNRLVALGLLEDRWESAHDARVIDDSPATTAGVRADPGEERMALATDDALYVSWGGSGRTESIRAALLHDFVKDTGFVLLAVLDSDHFGDLDDLMTSIIEEELAWLLETQVDLTKAQVGQPDRVARVIIRRGSVLELAESTAEAVGAGLVLIGSPVPPIGELKTASAVAEAITARTKLPTITV